MSKVLITGGAGFIGCNAAARFMGKGYNVIVFDNLSRNNSDLNLQWLKEQGKFLFIKEDIRNHKALKRLFSEQKDIDVVIHLASQVAVTTSITYPHDDFEINALGTLNLLEAIRTTKLDPILIYTSTNKVYGSLEDIEVVEEDTRYKYKDLPNGISEERGLDFDSPYGCSKGAGDQYVKDYSKTYGLKTVVLRASCIYGPHQFGVEDQGWIAWFVIASLMDKNIIIYGSGKQVRDVLYINDLLDAFESIIMKIETVKGHVLNIGGGLNNIVSLKELISIIERKLGKKINYSYRESRHSDQLVYISDISRIEKHLGWKPKVDLNEGLNRLITWLKKQERLF
ncbi:MAG: SDR family NAD(P)-dependent oxidoreductase [Deltaproteobacteria bacterium]|nr:MAG: SDR family NAD(P)-dependent oxidoreductase [Deltaproteobacteria bacterium]